MPRVETIKKARKDVGKCEKCGTVIKKGDSYRKWAFNPRFGGGKHVVCTSPSCSPKPSQLTQSAFYQSLYSLQETAFQNGAEDIADLEGQKDDVSSELENIKSECEEKLQNMPEGLQQGATGEMLQERIDAIDGALSELEGVDMSWDEPMEPDSIEEKGGKTRPESKEEFEERKEQELADRIEEILEELRGVLENISC